MQAEDPNLILGIAYDLLTSPALRVPIYKASKAKPFQCIHCLLGFANTLFLAFSVQIRQSGNKAKLLWGRPRNGTWHPQEGSMRNDSASKKEWKAGLLSPLKQELHNA